MRILHTADWHLGKRLGRYDRMADHRAVLAEIVDLADSEAVDLVIVAGDLFDRPAPPIESLGQVLSTLEQLARPERPVVAIAGNHDSPELFELLAPLLREQNVHLVGHLRAPDEGGILELEAGGETALVACLPFPRRGRVIDFLRDADSWSKDYAQNLRHLCRTYAAALAERGPAVKLLAAHLMMQGAVIGPAAAPRGERALHLSESYAAPEDAIPDGPQYVALGHVHAPQRLPGPAIPTTYCGSPLELDFGEAGEKKRILLIEAEPDRPVEIRSHELRSGRRLQRASGTWEEVIARSELYESYLDLTLLTAGPDPGLAERARHEFPYLAKVRAEYDRPLRVADSRGDQPWDALYGDYFRRVHEAEPSRELLDAFRDIYDLASHAPD